MDLFLELNVAIWGFIVPMLGVFRLVGFKKGGPYGEGGSYISSLRALVYLLVTALFSHFILSPVIRVFIESICLSNPVMKYILIVIGLAVMWFFIKRSRKLQPTA